MRQGPSGLFTTPFAVLDIDGCLVPGRGEAADLGPLSELRRMSQEHEGRLFTFATGRPVMYALALAQLLDVRVWVACEYGALLVDPVDLCVVWSSEVQERLWPATKREVLSALADLLPRVRLEPGKEATVSLHPADGDVAALFAAVRARLVGIPVDVHRSSLAVDVVPRGAGKGEALRALAERLALAPEQILAIGDSLGDVPMLQAAGFAACPANASGEARRAVAAKGERGRLSPLPLVAGVEESLRWYLGG